MDRPTDAPEEGARAAGSGGAYSAPDGGSHGDARSAFPDVLNERLARLRETAGDRDPRECSGDCVDRLYREVSGLARVARIHGVQEILRLAESLQATLAGLRARPNAVDRDLLRLGLARLEAAAEAWSRQDRAAPETRLQPRVSADAGGGRVQVVAEDPAVGEAVAGMLRDRGFAVVLSGAEPETGGAGGFTARVVCVGEVAPDSAVLARLQEPGGVFLPTLVVARAWSPGARLQAVREGAARCLDYPLADDTLLEQLVQIGGVVAETGYRVLLASARPEAADDTLAAGLREAGLNVEVQPDPDAALAGLHRGEVEVLVLDMDEGDCSAAEFAALLRTRDNGSSVPMLVLTADPGRVNELMALHPGASGVFLKPVEPQRLADAVVARARQQRQMDGVTRAYRQALYEREREREHLAVNEHALVSITDVAGDIMYANERFARVSGYAVSELLGRNHRLLKSGMHAPAFYAELWETIAAGRIWQGELCNRARDGSLYWVETTIVPYLDGDGLPYQYVSIRTDITAVKRQEHRLRSSQRFANMGTWEWTPGRDELEWSERIAPLLGHRQGGLEPTVDNFLGAVHPDDRERVENAIRSSLRRGSYLELEHRVVWPDGTVRWLLQRGDVERAANGEVLHMLGVSQDITKRKQSELALTRQTTRLREAQRLARVGHWEHDPASGALWWSDVVYEIFALYPGDAPVSMEGFRSFVHPEDRERLDREYAGVLAEGRGEAFLRIRRDDGELRHLHLIAHGESTGGREQNGRLTGTVQDVTELQQAQEELSLFRRIFEASEQAISVADREGRMVYNNPAVLEMTGFEEAELAGRSYRELIPAEAEQSAGEIDDIRESGGAWTGQLPIRCRNGAVFMSSSTIGVVRDRRGEPQYIFNIFGDFTAELQRRAELQRAREEAEQASRAKSDFLSNMSHELRTPMNAILGFAQLLRRDTSLDERQQSQLDEIARAGQHLLELINEILDLARIESGRLQVSPEPVDVADVVDECLSLLRPLAQEREVRLEGAQTATADAPRVQADRIRLKQVLLNLLSNAIKYNRAGGRVTLLGAPGQQGLQLEVHDTGPGLTAEQQERLFQPFDRLDADASGVEGSGVGLTITRHLVEMMDGRLGVTSTPGEGSCFWFELPLAADSAPRAAPARGPVDPTAAGVPALPASGTPHTVLCIDDQPTNLRLMEEVLGQEPDLQTVVADTPLKGLEEAARLAPDLILLDLAMPGMDGYQVLRALRADALLAAVPVLAVTADATDPTRERALAAGFAEVITKPVDPAGLRERVRGVAAEVQR